VIHFYHLWLGGAWKDIASEHLSALRRAEFPGKIKIGLVGDVSDRRAAKEMLRSWDCETVIEADAGFEEVTLRELHRHAQMLPADTPVLYAHNKGAFHNHAENKAWRHEMTDYLVRRWAERVAELGEYDVTAWRWLPEGTIDPRGNPITGPMAAGNFWWARAGYLKALPLLPEKLIVDNRHEAEVWLGICDPQAKGEVNQDSWPTVQVPMRWVPNPAINGMAQPGGHWEPVDPLGLRELVGAATGWPNPIVVKSAVDLRGRIIR
jgi:hypothetical protein